MVEGTLQLLLGYSGKRSPRGLLPGLQGPYGPGPPGPGSATPGAQCTCSVKAGPRGTVDSSHTRCQQGGEPVPRVGLAWLCPHGLGL